MHPLKVFLSSIEPKKRHDFAKICGTSLEQLKHIYSNRRKCNPTLAIEIEKHSNGAVKCDILSPKTRLNMSKYKNKILVGIDAGVNTGLAIITDGKLHEITTCTIIEAMEKITELANNQNHPNGVLMLTS